MSIRENELPRDERLSPRSQFEMTDEEALDWLSAEVWRRTDWTHGESPKNIIGFHTRSDSEDSQFSVFGHTDIKAGLREAIWLAMQARRREELAELKSKNSAELETIALLEQQIAAEDTDWRDDSDTTSSVTITVDVSSGKRIDTTTSVDAVDPHARSTGTPPTRDGESL